MQFDGSEIVVGDNLHDVTFGAGVVEHLIEGEGKIIVAFGNRTFSYDVAGVGHFPMKTLFWHDPIAGFVPMKDCHRWTHFCELRKVVAQTVWASNHIKRDN